MIRLKITVDTDGNNLVFHPWWDNLFNASRKDNLFKWTEVEVFLLENHNCRLVYDKDQGLDFFDMLPVAYVEFDNEHDATMFILRWS